MLNIKDRFPVIGLTDTMCPDGTTYRDVFDAAPKHTVMAYLTTIGISAYFGMPPGASRWVILLLKMANYGIALAIPIAADVSLYRAFQDGHEWSDWIQV